MPSEMYLDIVSAKTGKSIGGDSITKGRESQIQVKKFTVNFTSPEDYSTKQATGKMNMDDVEIEFAQGSISATILTMLSSNEQISQATLQVLKTVGAAGAGNADKRLFIEWRFKNARITSFKEGNESEAIADTIKIGFAIVEVDSYGQKADGGMSGKRTSSYDGNQGAGSSP